jgi:hypothetical protein
MEYYKGYSTQKPVCHLCYHVVNMKSRQEDQRYKTDKHQNICTQRQTKHSNQT